MSNVTVYTRLCMMYLEVYTHIIHESSAGVKYVSICTHTLHLVEICAIICAYTSRYIMHKRVYTVTLDIECWDDLKLDSIDSVSYTHLTLPTT